MKKAPFILLLFFCYSQITIGQKIAVANERTNILYLGIDNFLSVAAENTSFDALIVKTTNGSIRKEGEKYIYRSDSGVGRTDIILYKKVNNKLKEIGRSEFRVKRIPLPVFKIGSGRRLVKISELSSQEYARAVVENSEIDLNLPIEQFTMQIFSRDSSKSALLLNIGNKLSDEIKQALKSLKRDDLVIFSDIFITLLYEKHVEIDPARIYVID